MHYAKITLSNAHYVCEYRVSSVTGCQQLSLLAMPSCHMPPVWHVTCRLWCTGYGEYLPHLVPSYSLPYREEWREWKQDWNGIGTRRNKVTREHERDENWSENGNWTGRTEQGGTGQKVIGRERPTWDCTAAMVPSCHVSPDAVQRISHLLKGKIAPYPFYLSRPN